MANTLSTYTYRKKYFSTRLNAQLRKALVAEDVCVVDNGNALTIENPYITNFTVAITGLTGTYDVSDITTTDDTLTVDNEVKWAGHIKDYESRYSRVDLFDSVVDTATYGIKEKIDYFVVNNLCEDATGAYSTPSGGFNTTNTNTILSNLASKVMGYAEVYKGLFLIIENTDVPGVLGSQMASGFSYSDLAMKNGLVSSQAGIDIYVVRTGTFVDATIGTKTVTNANHRVFGVKKQAMYASLRNVQMEEKGVSGKTGKEVVFYGYVGFKLWAPVADLIVDVTLTA